MKQILHKTLGLRAWMVVAMLMAAVTGAWADDVTYTFTSKSWEATVNDNEANWTSGKDGNGFSNNGIQVATSASGANGTSPESYNNISKIVCVYNTNTSKGKGTIEAKIGDNEEQTKDWQYTSGSGNGTVANFKVEFNYSTPQSGNVKLTLNTTTNSIYLVSVTITYSNDSPDLEACDLALENAPVALTFDFNNNASAQVINYTTSGTGKISVSESDYADIEVDETEMTITVTPTAVTPSAQTITVSQEADDTYKAGSTTFTFTITDSTPIPTHTVTFSVNGETSTQDFEEGATITFPANPVDVNDKTFVGWAAAAITGTTDEAPEFVTSATMDESDVTYYAVFADKIAGTATEVTDVLTNANTINSTNSTYTSWTTTGTSGAVYSGQSAGDKGTIQLRSNNSNSGIVTTTSGGIVTKVEIEWNDETGNDRVIYIYGKSGKFESPVDLYNSGSESGSIDRKSTTFVPDYTYSNIGIRSKSGALYLNKVSITWRTGTPDTYSAYCTTVAEDTRQDPELSFSQETVDASIGGDPALPELNTAEGFNGTVIYASSDENVAQIMDSETGELRLVGEGTAIITATFAGNDDFKRGSASYTITVTDNRIATTISQENITLDITDVATLMRLTPVVKDADNNDVDYTNSPDGEGLPEVYFELVGEDTDGIIGSFDSHGNIVLNSAVGTATIKAVYNQFQSNSDYRPSECTFTITLFDSHAPGAVNNPYTVAQAIQAIDDANKGTVSDVYVAGIVSQVDSYNSNYSSITYWISDDGTTTNQFEVYSGKNIGGADFTAKEDVQVGDVVVVKGNITYYSRNSIYEFAANNELVSLQRIERPAAPTFSPEGGSYTSVQSVTLTTETEDATIYYTIDGSEPTTSSNVYSEAITVDETMTIKAIAVKNDVSSLVATATFTIDLTPSIVFDGTQNPTNVPYTAGNTNIHYVASNLTGEVQLVICDSEGSETTYDWFSAELNGETYVAVAWEENKDTENARTAYFKLTDGTTVSDIFAITQAKYVVDYATLQFEFDGGRADIESTNGLTYEELGSDYGSSPKLKFDTTGDYLILKINERPGTLKFDIKGNGFSGGSFKVQTSEDGNTYTDLETYTSLGNTQNEEFDNLDENVRYIKWVYTEKINGNVALGNIVMAEYVAPSTEPSIALSTTLIEATAAETDGTITVTYNNITEVMSEVKFYEADGETEVTYGWIDAEIDEENNVYYSINANTSESRTAYMKVYALGDNAEDVYSELITISQVAYVPAIAYSLATTITSGKHYLIVGGGQAMGYDKGNNRAAVDVTINEGNISITDNEVNEVVICGPDANGYYTIFDSKTPGYLHAASNSSNHLKTAKTTDINGLWEISFDIDGVASIVASGSSNRNVMQYNASSSIFSCYASDSQNPVYLYEKDDDVAAEPDYTRAVTNKWGTICLPNVATITGAHLYSIGGLNEDGTAMTLVEKLGTAEAGVPYIFQATSNNVAAYYTGVAAIEENNESNNGLYGSFTGTGVAEGMYLLSGGQIVKCGTGCSIGANRAYIDMSEVPEYTGEAGVKLLIINDFVDGIGSMGEGQSMKNDATIYNLAGQRVNKAVRGLYIVNGKKVVLK